MHQARERLNDLEEMTIPLTSKMAVVLFFVLLLSGTIAAPWFFTWSGLALAVFLFYVTQWGITIGYHRLLTHDSFKTYAWVRAFFALIGTLAIESGVILWVAYHRKHHQYSDKKGDPHSPLDIGGFLWGHWLWIVYAFSVSRTEREAFQNRYAKDLMDEPMIRFINDYHLYINVIFVALILRLGLWWGGMPMMWSFLFWGVALRVFLMAQATWLVNSATHLWGYRNYETRDNSRNNKAVAWFSSGEGWHNNHHGTPTAANHGQKPGEFDLSYKIILLMGKLGLAWDINTVLPPPPLSEQK